MVQLTKARLRLISSVIILLLLFILDSKFCLFDRLPFVKNNITISNEGNVDLNGLQIFYVTNDYSINDRLSNENKILLVSGDKIIKDNLNFDLYGKEYLLFVFNEYTEKHSLKSFKYDSWIKIDYNLNVKKKNDTLVFVWKIDSKKAKSNEGIINIK